MDRRARVLIVGGDDVDKRIDLMEVLDGEFELAAAGSGQRSAARFAGTDFPLFHFPMTRGANPLSDFRSYWALRQLYTRYRPDIVHTFATKPCVWGRFAAHAAGVPIVVGTLPGLGSLYSTRRLGPRLVRLVYEPLQRAACRRSDMTVFQNPRDAGQFVSAGICPPSRMTVIYGSGVRTDEFSRDRVDPIDVSRVRRDAGVRRQDILVTMISRVIRSKGVMEYAAVARHLSEAYPNVRFFLVGPDDQDSLDRLSPKELEEVEGAVTWLGERSDVKEILAASDIFTLPSHYREGVPRVLIEAASMSLPLIAPKAPGCEDICHDGTNGFLVSSGKDTRELAHAIGKLIEQPILRRRFAAASRELAVRRFDLSVVASDTAELYRRLLRDQHLAQNTSTGLRPTTDEGEAPRPRRVASAIHRSVEAE